jgi:Tfp pilus assembly protein PilX
MRAVHKFKRPESGIALLTTMLLLLLMSSLLVGFVLLISSGQKLSGLNNDYSKAFYAAEAGMEKLTADIGTLFNSNYAPTGVQLANIQTKPPILAGINYVKFDGSTGYLSAIRPMAMATRLRTLRRLSMVPSRA